jgi:pimeloyl-ACP methyl ester carboxylesterase
VNVVLLLIPGMFNPPAVWDLVRAELAAAPSPPEVRVLDVTSQDSIGAMADNGWRLLADLPDGCPLVLAGFSMGGYVALDMLARRPGRVQGLAMVDSSAGVETPESLVVREKTVAALARNPAKTIEGIIQFGLHPDNLGKQALVEGLRVMMQAVGPEAASRQVRALSVRRDHRPWLAHWRGAALVLCGREDRVTPPSASHELLALLPQASACWVDGAGHMTPLEAPATVAAALQQLCRAVREPS